MGQSIGLFLGFESVSIAVMLVISVTLVTLETLVTLVSLVMLMSLVETNKDSRYDSGFIVASDGCKARDAGNVSGVCTASDASNASFLTPWVMKRKHSPSFVSRNIHHLL